MSVKENSSSNWSNIVFSDQQTTALKFNFETFSKESPNNSDIDMEVSLELASFTLIANYRYNTLSL